MNELALAEMLSTRLCHDLTGPIGAVNNGVEFLTDDPSMQEDAVQLISSSAQQAVARLQFYRQAYGRAGDVAEVNVNDRQQLADAFFQGTKIRIIWPDAASLSKVILSSKDARLLLNLILIASYPLMKGGAIMIEIPPPGSSELMTLRASGELMRYDPELFDPLTKPLDGLVVSPKNVQPLLTLKLAQDLSVRLDPALGEETMSISAKRVADSMPLQRQTG